MAEKSKLASSSRRLSVGSISIWFIGILSVGLLAFLFVQITSQVVGTPPARRLTLVQDIPLPTVLPPQFLPNVKNVPAQQDPLAPGVAVRFDHFDFQALDPSNHLLFIAHSGPNPDKVTIYSPNFNPDKDGHVDGHVLVFDTQQNKVVGRVDVPHITGMVVAPDLGRVYAADSIDNIVYSIDEKTLKPTAIQLDTNEGPDAISYDPNDQKVFVSDPGLPSPDTINPNNQNISVINTQTNKVTKINLGHLPKLPNESADLVQWGYDVGHNKYDPGLHLVFVTIQQLTNQTITPLPLPPPGTGELVAINPVTQHIVGRLQLPTTCSAPHGMTIDTQEHIAFIACVNVDPAHNVVQSLVRVDLQTMNVLPDPLLTLALKPDIVVLDHTHHVLYVGCATGISIFDVQGRTIRKLGDYVIGKGTHTVAVDEATQMLYLPLVELGGRPVLRIVRFDPNGI